MSDPLDVRELVSQAIVAPPSDTATEPIAYAKAPRFRVVHASKLIDLPPIEYLDEGHELPKGKMVTYYGPSGVGKSFLVQDQSLAYCPAFRGRVRSRRRRRWVRSTGAGLVPPF